MEKNGKKTPSHHHRSFTSKKNRGFTLDSISVFVLGGGGFIHKIGFTGVEDRRYIGKRHCKNWLNIETIYIIIYIYMILYDMYLCIYNVNTFSKNTCTTYIHHRNKSPCCIYQHFIQLTFHTIRFFAPHQGISRRVYLVEGGPPCDMTGPSTSNLASNDFNRKMLPLHPLSLWAEFITFLLVAPFSLRRGLRKLLQRAATEVTSFVTSNCRHVPNRHFPSIHFGS